MTNIRLPQAGALEQQPAPLQSWGQVFEPVRSAESLRIGRAIRAATGQMTCWGTGKINVRRADDATILAVCGSEVSHSAMQKLLALRAEPGQTGLSALVERMTINNKDRTALRRLITDGSRCHSLWIVCRSRLRSWTTLTVDHPGDGSGSEYLVFTW
jgi:hypothetical protein